MEPLYKTSGRLLALLDIEDELDEQAFADTLEGIEGEFQDKAASVGLFIKTQEHHVDAIDAEIRRLTERKRRLTNTVSRVKDYLRQHMVDTGTRKAGSSLVSLGLRKAPERLIINGDPPPQFVTTETITKVDKRGILAAMKEGAEFADCELLRGPDSLVIK